MNEAEVQDFWNAHPCGDHIVGGLGGRFADDHERFFAAYDAWRYTQEAHILACLDRFDFREQRVLEIGLGQGADSEQLIRRGARWSGLDLTAESTKRVRLRLTSRALPFDDIKQGSALEIPWPDNSFDIVFSHGVLHHIPEIGQAQSEIHRVLKPGGTLIAMFYARNSLNFQVSIRLVRRAILALAYPLRDTPPLRRAPEILRTHLANARDEGLRNYLRLENFTHRSTDGPLNPFARVYTPDQVAADFPAFELVDTFTRYMHAPPLPVRRLPLGHRMGWHLWTQLRARTESAPDASPDPRRNRT